MTSLEMRNDALFMRNEFETVGNWQIPLVRKQNVNISNLSLIACSNTKKHENVLNLLVKEKIQGVHLSCIIIIWEVCASVKTCFHI